MSPAALQVGVAVDFAPVHGERFVDRLAEIDPVLDAVDRLGFGAVSAGESYPRSSGDPMGFHAPNSLMILAAIAPRTAAPQLIAGTLLLGAWPIDRLRWDVALAGDLAGGRLVLGIGLGPADLWARRSIAGAAIGDAADELIARLAGERRDGSPPLWIGGGVARSLERAARFGDGYTASSGYPIERVARQIAGYRGLGGRGPTSVNRACVLADSAAEAASLARVGVEPLLRNYAGYGTVAGCDARSPAEELTSRLGIVGTAADAVAQVNRYVAAGVTHLQLRPAAGPTPIATAVSTLERFARDVWPHVDPLPAASVEALP